MDKNNLDFKTYTIQDLYSTKFYIVHYLKRDSIKVVTGAFIRGHFDDTQVLTNPYESERLANKELEEHQEDYRQKAMQLYKEKHNNVEIVKKVNPVKEARKFNKIVVEGNIINKDMDIINEIETKINDSENSVDTESADKYQNKDTDLVISSKDTKLAKIKNEITEPGSYKRYYVVYSYTTALGLCINKTEIKLNKRPGLIYTTEYLINIFASMIIKSLKNETKFSNLIIINFMEM